MSLQNYSNVVKKYNDAIENISAKIVQDREGFMQQLGNIYSQGKKNFVNSDFLDYVEKKILVRDFSNNMKSFSDKSQLVDHIYKVNNALKGGASTDLKDLRYAAKRDNALFWNLNEKLHRQRLRQEHELELIATVAKQLPLMTENYTNFLDKVVSDHKLYNSRKRGLDVAQWEQLNDHVNNLVQNDGSILKAGAANKLTGGSTGYNLSDLDMKHYNIAKRLIQ